jgi:hypothetical protein
MSDHQAAWNHLGQEIRKLKKKIERLRLTDAERFVLREVRDICADVEDIASHERAAVIDGLLERTRT